jgi:hypothetical protein
MKTYCPEFIKALLSNSNCAVGRILDAINYPSEKLNLLPKCLKEKCMWYDDLTNSCKKVRK